MSNVRSLEQAIADSTALAEVADEAGVTVDVAKRVCAALASMPARQVIRICATTDRDAERRRERDYKRQTERRRRSS